MEPNDDGERQRRGSCVAILLTGGFACFVLVLLVLATGGWAIHVLWIATAIGTFGLVHYLLWGRMMLQQTAGEREEEEVRQRAEEREREEAERESDGFHRFH